MAVRFGEPPRWRSWLIEHGLAHPRTLAEVAKYGGVVENMPPWPDHLPKSMGAAESGQMDFEDGSWVNLSGGTSYFVTPGLEAELRARLGEYFPRSTDG